MQLGLKQPESFKDVAAIVVAGGRTIISTFQLALI